MNELHNAYERICKCFSPLGPLGPKVYCRPRRRLRRRRTQPFGYYINMVQQIEFIIHTNIQPLRQFFHTMSKS